ncbi:ABC transporter ATP-binding protein [Effusibacillus lacus]|uniref:ABC transporter ATP-binding protein n=1 Tax=Effusibacillus lacus TaxID=1348429 RepID=A0A292YKU1_9BACL|nr:ABC transporter ATP-binding protein [Effusibacillus lacus]TCS75882.1 peptide/nickel transport system ATP-binding protein [Effusibacillus lacus]GAX91727.1 ABC transporter ATP-binding protein [Effusibacillus lacus]
MAPLLEVQNLKVEFMGGQGSVTVVEDVDLVIEPAETLGVVGESGCGKSVTSLSIMRLLGKNGKIEGQIRFDGKDLVSLTEREMQGIRGNKLAMIFQEPMTSLNPLHTIGKQISEPLVKHLKLSKAEAKQKAIQLLKDVGIPRPEEIFSEFPHQLSGGMRQRVMIAVAMACGPKLIIADEPTTALDVTIQAQILHLMKRLKKEHRSSIMLITHDLGVVAEMCDRVVVMYAGQIVEEADVRNLFKSPKHPYTVGLMKSMPALATGQERLDSIPGVVPLPTEMPKGCRFAPRCGQVMEICREKAPELAVVEGSHKCRCWLYTGEGQ